MSQELGHDPSIWQLQMDHNRQVHILPRGQQDGGAATANGGGAAAVASEAKVIKREALVSSSSPQEQPYLDSYLQQLDQQVQLSQQGQGWF